MKTSSGSGMARCVGLGALLALAAVALAAQDSVATFHVNVRLVSIFVNVTDKSSSTCVAGSGAGVHFGNEPRTGLAMTNF